MINQAIMTDPVMQSILQQAQSDPAALQDHMKNPMIQSKILKLVQAGIIKTGSHIWVIGAAEEIFWIFAK